MAHGDEIILHHYDSSPFSEKIRLILGYKGLSWRSVQIPVIMPKPDLMPLTGGYRKTPVMQIGADIYCDTQRIARELEARFPEPSLFPFGHRGVSWAVGMWTDRAFFNATVAIIFGSLADQVPEDFIKDRERFAGRPFDVNAMKAAVPMMRDHWRASVAWLDDQLTDERAFLLGDKPALSDFNAMMNIWFLRNGYPPASTLLDEFPRVQAWADRIAAFGHGTPSPMDAKEALSIAKAATSIAQPAEDPRDPNGRKPGDKVTVMADDTGRDPITGTLVASDAHSIAIAHEAPEVGSVTLHFPRAGFLVM